MTAYLLKECDFLKNRYTTKYDVIKPDTILYRIEVPSGKVRSNSSTFKKKKIRKKTKKKEKKEKTKKKKKKEKNVCRFK